MSIFKNYNSQSSNSHQLRIFTGFVNSKFTMRINFPDHFAKFHFAKDHFVKFHFAKDHFVKFHICEIPPLRICHYNVRTLANLLISKPPAISFLSLPISFHKTHLSLRGQSPPLSPQSTYPTDSCPIGVSTDLCPAGAP